MTDLERALADIAEVRERLGHVQRFRGYSAAAAMASGVLAVAGGILQALLLPHAAGAQQAREYFALWFCVCAASMIVNYGAIAHWFVNDASARERWQTATVGFSILPSIAVGAALSFAMLRAGLPGFLPGIWCACYGAGLFASRTTLPPAAVAVSTVFLAAGIALLFAPAALALAWWVLPLTFGAGQLVIGVAVARG